MQHDFSIKHHESESRYFSGEEKVRLPKRHLVEGRPISAICDEPEIPPTFFYQWRKTFFENGQSDCPAIVYLRNSKGLNDLWHKLHDTRISSGNFRGGTPLKSITFARTKNTILSQRASRSSSLNEPSHSTDEEFCGAPHCP